MLTEARRYGLAVLLTFLTSAFTYAQGSDSKRPWKGYSILGNGHLTAVYSDDNRISALTRARGIQHFYFGDYTADYVASTSFELPGRTGPATVGMKNFFTAQTRTPLANGSSEMVLCFVHPDDAAVLSVSVKGSNGDTPYQFTALLRKEIKTDRNIILASLRPQGNIALASWSNGTALAVMPTSANVQVTVNESSVTVAGG